MLEGIEFRRVKLSDLNMIYEMHESKFPTPARARYYEELMKDKTAPFYVAVNDSGEVLGFITTRVESRMIRGLQANQMKIAVFASNVGEDSEVDGLEIKRGLVEKVQNDFNTGGYEEIQAQVRKSSKESLKVLREAGFQCVPRGKYKDGETKLICSYTDFEVPDLNDKTIKLEKMNYRHLNRVMALHNNNLKAQKEYAYFRKFMRNSGGVFVVATDARGRVAGYLAARRQYMNPDDEESPRTLLNFISMAVDEKYRGRGIAKSLVRELLRQSEESDVQIIKGHVRESNIGARKLYKKFGFKEIPAGNYKDTGEIKYRLHYRVRHPPLLPIIKPYFRPVGLFALGFIVGRQTR